LLNRSRSEFIYCSLRSGCRRRTRTARQQQPRGFFQAPAPGQLPQVRVKPAVASQPRLEVAHARLGPLVGAAVLRERKVESWRLALPGLAGLLHRAADSTQETGQVGQRVAKHTEVLAALLLLLFDPVLAGGDGLHDLPFWLARSALRVLAMRARRDGRDACNNLDNDRH